MYKNLFTKSSVDQCQFIFIVLFIHLLIKKLYIKNELGQCYELTTDRHHVKHIPHPQDTNNILNVFSMKPSIYVYAFWHNSGMTTVDLFQVFKP